MPIYEYVCEKCGSHLEAMQKVGAAPLKRCRKCRGKLEKIVSRTSFQLKGAGWYVSDYSRKSADTNKSADTSKNAEKKVDTTSSSDAA